MWIGKSHGGRKNYARQLKPQRRETKKMRVLSLPIDNIDDMWDEIRFAYQAAVGSYDDMMYDLDDGSELSIAKMKSLKGALAQLEHKIGVFRRETEV